MAGSLRRRPTGDLRRRQRRAHARPETVAVMGGTDWERWITFLDDRSPTLPWDNAPSGVPQGCGHCRSQARRAHSYLRQDMSALSDVAERSNVPSPRIWFPSQVIWSDSLAVSGGLVRRVIHSAKPASRSAAATS
ncbi:hypothetical protein AB0M68_36655 [Streptomyces sp. NPDC051453]|uniref:hypothetical protein n=1 Tax=Streptomyces sp. NPDC051453 TaxID=3154941 RepID=UPI00342DC2CE